MPGAEWFPGATLNYAEHMLPALDAVAVVARSNTREPLELTFAELGEQVARARAGLQRLGVQRGDRVVAYLPNIPETLVAFLACASLGAIWASVAPEFGARSVVDRFAQIEPKVLLAVDGYVYRDRRLDRSAEVEAIAKGLPTLEHVIHVGYGDDAQGWAELVSQPAEPAFDPVPFDHPLYVLFSSGTTGLPKPIVHGHGGILLEHVKNLGLGWDLKPGGRILWFSTTAWMMWNALVSGLLLRSSIVMIDGDPAWPDLSRQWQVAAETAAEPDGRQPGVPDGVPQSGPGPARVRPGEHPRHRHRRLAAARRGLRLHLREPRSGRAADQRQRRHRRLQRDRLRRPAAAGLSRRDLGPLPRRRHRRVRPRGQRGRRRAGRARDPPADALDARALLGRRRTASATARRTSTSTPVSGARATGCASRAQGTCIVTGRSDATLNRGGVRMGTSELYAVVEEFAEVDDSLIVHLEDDEGGPGELVLFVVADLDDALRERLSGALRSQLSPRHVPDTIAAVPAIPRTLTGKKLEAPVKRILRGAPADSVASRGALADPRAIDAFVQFSEGRGR